MYPLVIFHSMNITWEYCKNNIYIYIENFPTFISIRGLTVQRRNSVNSLFTIHKQINCLNTLYH